MTGRFGQVVGYCRVSTVDQNEARQVAALGKVDRLFVDKASGSSTDRAELNAMLAYVRDGDTVRVKSPDRLARSTTDLLALIKSLRSEGVEVEFTDSPGLSTTSDQGEFMLTILAAVAQLERATIRERQMEGIALAKARGVYQRQPKLTAEQVATARDKIDRDGVPVARVARDLGVSRQTVYSALRGEGPYARTGGSPQ
ncbi:recombinase family protein [Demequina flava]|uniref:recombinase family protein n=1 Tax=Demequina flava TaxID=1095025 RepID=UPI000784EDAA|nr:recombinase family protein [Demequina flava]